MDEREREKQSPPRVWRELPREDRERIARAFVRVLASSWRRREGDRRERAG